MSPPEPLADKGRARRVELLAPAGGLEAGLAAFRYGADAVYLGLKRYSARADAQNFSFRELDQLLGYARSLTPARRVFVAMNTLVLEEELFPLTEALGTLAELRPDALIVQDLGVLRVARRHFKDLELHASTQLAAHSRAAVETLRDRGFSRVTLAREMTLPEIREAAAVPGVEVETFLHGALCYAYSGLCLFSSQVAGRSGNRGQCAYPCRGRFQVTSLNGEPAGKGPGALPGGFAFSMKDLALPEHVEALREAGVKCLKIEGRKKAPLYVAATVDFYRRLLDGTMSALERPAREADLKATFARPFTTLYLDSRMNKDVADRDLVGHRGVPVGKLLAVVKRNGLAAVRFRATRPLSLHDGLQVEVSGLDRPYGFGVSALRVLDPLPAGEVYEAPADALLEVPLPSDHPTLTPGALISCSSSQEVKERYRFSLPNLAPHRSRRPVDLRAEVAEGRVHLTATVASAPGRAVTVEEELSCATDLARDPARMEDAARGAFEKLGDTPFRLEGFSWHNPAGRFVPVSRLNELRRGLTEGLVRALALEAAARVAGAKEDLAPTRAPLDTERLGWTVKVDRLVTLEAFLEEDFLEVDDLILDLGLEPGAGLKDRLAELAGRAGGRDRVRLALPLIVRSWEEKGLRLRVKELREAGFTRFEVTNPASFGLLGLPPGDKEGMGLTSDSSLYVVNRGAARELFEMGVERVTLSTEDCRKNQGALLKELGRKASVVVYEDSPLFVSESCPYANLSLGCPGPRDCTFSELGLTSSHGGEFRVVNERCRSVTLGEEPFNLSGRLREIVAAGARSLRVHFVHRTYPPIRAREIWRALRRLEEVRPGNKGSFDRPGW